MKFAAQFLIFISFSLSFASALHQPQRHLQNGEEDGQYQLRVQFDDEILRPFNASDLVTLPRIGQLSLSPDGRLVVFPRSIYNMTENKSRKHLWAMAVDTSDLTQITFGDDVSDDQPVWVSDDEILFIRSGGSAKNVNQLLLLNLEDLSKGPRQVSKSDIPYSLDNLKYNIAGKFLAFTSEVYADSATLKDSLTKEKPDDFSSARVFDKIYFRHWDRFDNHKNSHVFIVPFSVGSGSVDVDQARNIMVGRRDISCPIPPFGDGSQFVFSKNGSKLLFASMKNFDKSVQAYSTESHIYLMDVASVNSIDCLSCDQGVGAKSNPTFSPDGNFIAWTQMKVPQFEADKNNLVVMDVATGKKNVLTSKWDRSVESYTWSLDSSTLYVVAQEQAREKIFAINVNSGAVSLLVGEGSAGSLITVPNRDFILYTQSTMKRPSEIFSVRPSDGFVFQKTKIYEKYLKSVDMVDAEEFWFTGAKNEKVMGWFMKPANYNPNKKYPLAYLIHGGPQGSWMDSFSARWNPQIFTGAGFAVAMVNFHGSTGYGQAFTDSISKNWGSYPFQDLMNGLDYVLKQNPWIDSSKVAGLGASYGGYMINWINGHTDRFVCLVNHDGLFDLKSMYYQTEELYFPEYEMGGTPYEKPELYDKWNPSGFVKNWKTPVLIVHGGKDYRVPEGEGFATFTALQRKGIESKLLYFPDENHWVLKQANSLRWHKEVLNWITKWTN